MPPVVSKFAPNRVVAFNARYIDPALDIDAFNHFAYRQNRREDVLRFKPGMSPTWFSLVPLGFRFGTAVLDSVATSSDRLVLAFRAACHLIEPPGRDALRPASTVPGAQGKLFADDEWIDTVVDEFGGETVLEMGQIAWDLTRLKPGEDGPFVVRLG